MGGCLLIDNLRWASTMFGLYRAPAGPGAASAMRWREMWLERLEQSRCWSHDWLRHQRRDEFWKHGSVCEDWRDSPARSISWAAGPTAIPTRSPRMLGPLRARRRGWSAPGRTNTRISASPARDRLPPGIPALVGQMAEGHRDRHHGRAAYRVWMEEPVEPPLRLYDERPGRWVAEPDWPPVDRPDPRRCTLRADGRLAEEPDRQRAAVLRAAARSASTPAPGAASASRPRSARPARRGRPLALLHSAPLPERTRDPGRAAGRPELAVGPAAGARGRARSTTSRPTACHCASPVAS